MHIVTAWQALEKPVHTTAVLFYLEANVEIQGTKTCTLKVCECIIPSSFKTIEYLPTKDIDFSSVQGKRKLILTRRDYRKSP